MSHETNGGAPPRGDDVASSDAHRSGDFARGEQRHPEGVSPRGTHPTPRRRWSSRKGIAAVVLVVLASGLAIHFSRGHSGTAGAHADVRQPPAAITVGQSKTADINMYVDGLGTVTPVYTVTVFTVVFSVSEDDRPQIEQRLRAGNTLAVDAFDRSDERQIESGTLTSMDNQVDTTTGTVKFRAQFANPDLALFPNQFVNARLLVQTLHKVTLVPTAAVQHNGTDAFVYVVKPDNTVAVQPITPLTANDRMTAVQGVNAGVNLATGGFDRLENGARVLVRAPLQGRKQPQAHGSAGGEGGAAA